ncbi:universal stress protein [Thermosulfuriphilus sp.]
MYPPKRILIALDTSENAMRAVGYVAEMLGDQEDIFIELLHVAKEPPVDLFPDEQERQKAKEAQEKAIVEVFELAKNQLEIAGVSREKVVVKVLPTTGSVARIILDEQNRGQFGTVVVGRRGVSKAEEFLFGSVSNKVVHYAKGCAVWVVE